MRDKNKVVIAGQLQAQYSHNNGCTLDLADCRTHRVRAAICGPGEKDSYTMLNSRHVGWTNLNEE